MAASTSNLQPTWTQVYWEPTRPWLTFAWQARSILVAGTALQAGKVPSRDDWERTEEVRSLLAVNSVCESPADRCSRPCSQIGSRWRTFAPLRRAPGRLDAYPGRDWTASQAVRSLGCPVASRGGASTQLSACSSCGRAFIPKRMPRSNQRRYCSSCGVQAAWRWAAQCRRARMRAPWLTTEISNFAVARV